MGWTDEHPRSGQTTVTYRIISWASRCEYLWNKSAWTIWQLLNRPTLPHMHNRWTLCLLSKDLCSSRAIEVVNFVLFLCYSWFVNLQYFPSKENRIYKSEKPGTRQAGHPISQQAHIKWQASNTAFPYRHLSIYVMKIEKLKDLPLFAFPFSLASSR